jgi:sugar/nucleoside kinase (ribokinase family)
VSEYDIVCVGSPFLDVTFVGLERLPALGEELFARELELTPGGTAITAVGAARLGLRSALLWPRATDLAGQYLQSVLAAEGVDWLGRESARAAVSAVLPVNGDRAFATFQPDDVPDAEEIAAVDTTALVVGVNEAATLASAALVYAVGGFNDSVRHDARSLRLDGCRALVLNEGEALRMTGAPDAEQAATALAATGADAVVVTLGSAGALELSDSKLVRAPAPEVEALDTTGAGDLFVAAYVFADLAGAARPERLSYAGLYAGLSVRTATGVRGAPTLSELEHEARERGLPPVHRSFPREENR